MSHIANFIKESLVISYKAIEPHPAPSLVSGVFPTQVICIPGAPVYLSLGIG